MLVHREEELNLINTAHNHLAQFSFRFKNLESKFQTLDDSSRKLKSHHDSDVVHLTTKHVAHKNEITASIRQMENQLKVLEANVKRARVEAVADQATLDKQNATNSELRAVLDDLVEQYKAKVREEKQFEYAVDGLVHKIEYLQDQKASLEQEQTSRRADEIEAERDLISAEARQKKYQDELNQERYKQKEQLEKVAAELALCKRIKKEMEDRLRKEFKALLDTELHRIQKEAAQQANSEITLIKTKHDEIMSEMLGDIDNLLSEANKLNQEREVENDNIERFQAQTRSGEKDIIHQHDLCQDLEYQLSTHKASTDKKIALHTREIENLKRLIDDEEERYRAEEAALAISQKEIQAYNLLIDVNIEDPGATDATVESQEPDHVAPLVETVRSGPVTRKRTRSSTRLSTGKH